MIPSILYTEFFLKTQSGYVQAIYLKRELDARMPLFFPGFSKNWGMLDRDKKNNLLLAAPDEKQLWIVLVQLHTS